jgi:hypothetical protein
MSAWVRIHKSFVRDKDVDVLNEIQYKFGANFNTHTSCSMWYDFESLEKACGFVQAVTKKIPYLKITMGN